MALKINVVLLKCRHYSNIGNTASMFTHSTTPSTVMRWIMTRPSILERLIEYKYWPGN